MQLQLNSEPIDNGNSLQDPTDPNDCSIAEQIEQNGRLLSEELNGMHTLMSKSETPKIYLTHLQRLVHRLKHVKNPS